VRALIRKSVRDAGGHEVDARADEYFAVFRQPARALVAAIGIQRSLQKREWPDEVDVCVRIGIHSGRTTLTETGYVGIAVNVAARVCSAGHGGQILVSSAARDLLAIELADGITLRSLGRYTFAGLAEPEALFQVRAADLRVRFPKLRAVAASR
jgi:class 3 adenylate cyclase